jgi:hypothetical protein
MRKNYSLFEKTKNTNSVFMFFVMLLCLFVNTINAQIGVTVTNNTNTTPNLATSYTSFANALTDLNAVSAMSGPITLTLAAGNETTPATGLILGSATLNPVLNATNTITIIGAGVTFTTLNAGIGVSTPTSAAPDAILKLVGVDYVTIDGIAFTDGNTTNPATMEVGLGMFKLSATDGCNNNTIQNCLFNMQRVNNAASTAPMVEGAVGIAMMNSTALAATTALTVTASSGTNSNNKFYSNTIIGGNYGMALIGFAAVTPFTLADTNNEIGALGLGNAILNFGGGAATSPSAGIRTLAQYGLNVSYNNVNNNTGSGVNHLTTLRGIFINTATSASVNINNNFVTVQSGGTTSLLEGIDNASGSTAASNTININNNTVSIGYPTATTAVINGILNSGTANLVNINSNTVSQILGVNLAGTGTWVMIEGGSPGGTLNTNNNIISNITRIGASGSFRGVKATTPVGLWTCSGNLLENISYSAIASTGGIDGIYDLSSATLMNISNNIVRNLSTPTTGTINGININTVSGTHTCSNNQVYNFTTASGGVGGATFTGIVFSVGNATVFGNQIYALNSTGTTGGTGGAITGIRQSGGTTNSIYNNKIYNLSSTSTGAIVYGVNASGGTTNTIYNNIIGDLRASAANLANAIRGIDIASTNANVYHNTIHLNATSSGAVFGTSAINVSSTTNLDVKNNIFNNTSTANTTGFTAAYRRSTTVLTAYLNASNNNLFYAGTPSTSNLIFYDGTNSDQTLVAFKARVTPREVASVTENPTFVSTTGSNINFLHIDTAVPTLIESGGSVISTVSTDFDNNIRFGAGGYTGTGFGTDIGADEFEGVPNIPACSGSPAASTTNAPTSVCAGTTINLSLGTSYSFTGISYQWQSSPDGIIPYTNIAGQNFATATTSQTSSTFYQCVITCTNGGATTISTPVQVTMNSIYTCYCASTYTSGPGTTDQITNVTLGTLNNTSGASTTPYYTFFNAVTVPDLPQNSNQTISISFGSDGNQYAGVWIDWNQDADFADSGEFVANSTINAGANGTTVLTIAVPAGASLGNTLMRVRGGNDSVLANTPCGASSSGFGETEDYIVNIVTNPICTGAPVASNTTAPTSVCSGVNFNLGLSVVQIGTGYTYQWQSSPDGIAPYVNISGQIATTATLSQTGATYYQCVITCTGSGLTTISTPIQVAMSSVYACYCASTYGSGTGATGGDAITNVTLGTLNNSSNAGATPTPAPYYTFYNAVTVPDLTQGSGQTMTISFGTDGSQFSGVWIDYNQDGDLLDSGEFVANSTVTAGASGTSTLTFTVPVGATLGNTLMRVRGGNDTVLTNTPCGASSSVWGETEDYIVNITACIAPSISTQPLAQSICENSNVTLSVVATGTGLTYQWKKEGVDIATATSATYTISGALVSDSGNYSVLVTGACGSLLSDIVAVTVTANSSLPTEVVSVCDTYTWSANGTTYTTGGMYTSTTNCVTRTLDLTITPSSSLPTETISACDSYTWSANGTVYTVGGIYTSTTACVTRTLDLTITPSSSLPTEVVSVCDTYTWSANGTTYTTGGMYTSTINCVTRTLDLTITTSSSLPTEVVSVCDTYTWSANGTTYTTGGMYTSTTNCVTRTLDLTITVATISGAATQVINGGVAADVTIEDIVVTTNGTVTWFASAADATANTNPLPAGTQLVDGNIYYGVTNIGICRSTTLAVTVTVVLGNASFDLSQLNYYPNPVKDIFNVKYSKEIISVDVYDLTGRKVIEMKPNTLDVELNMINLSNAMYIVRLQSVDGITELKVYKN